MDASQIISTYKSLKNRILSAPYAYFDGREVADLAAQFTTDPESVAAAIHGDASIHEDEGRYEEEAILRKLADDILASLV